MTLPKLAFAPKAKGRKSDRHDEIMMDDLEIMPPSSDFKGGLKVAVKYVTDVLKQENKSGMESLHDIKAKMGVSAKDLEASREHLEEEVKGRFADGGQASSTSETVFEDATEKQQRRQKDAENDIGELVEEISKLEQELATHHKTLDEKLDEDAVWDTKENSRELLMRLGSLHLELFDATTAASSASNMRTVHTSTTLSYLKDAKSLFSSALEVVKELETLNHGGDDAAPPNLSFMHGGDVVTRRTLCLLRGRAQVNVGIAVLELARYSTAEEGSRRSLLPNAMDQLVLAKESAKEMQAWCNAVSAAAPFHVRQEALIDKIRATELESFANRFLGVVLWDMGNHWEAAKVMDEASVNRMFTLNMRTNAAQEAYISFLAHRYYATIKLAEMAVNEAEKCFVACSSRMAQDPAQRKKEGDDFVVLAIRGYRRAKIIVGDIRECSGKALSSSLEEHDIANEEDLKASIKDLEEWRKQMKVTNEVQTPLKASSNDKQSRMYRNDVPNDLSNFRVQPPPTVMVLPVSKKRRKKSHTVARSDAPVQDPFLYHGNEDEPRRHRETSGHVSENIRYRKWGDQLLPQVPKEGGGTIVLYEYPGCSPPLPPDFQKNT